MKQRILLLFLLSIGFTISSGQNSPKWDNWKWLTGDWIGEGAGQPGTGQGSFSFFFDLDSNILTRKSHSEYPAEGNRPATIHDDLMIVYPGNDATKAVYFDNEGHTIFYSVTYFRNSIVLTSEKAQNMPVFRLTYTLLDSGLVNTRFEMSQDGQKYIPYIEGNSKKVNK